MDAADRMVRLRALIWAGALAFVATIMSLYLAARFNATPPVLFLYWLAGPAIGWAIYRLAIGITEAGGAVMGTIHHPSGASTPVVREYSKPQALAAQGQVREAIEAYEDCVVVYPGDPEPYVRIARLYRDRMDDGRTAIDWFRRARVESVIDPGREMLVTQEIIEIYRGQLGEPGRAIPELARLIDRFPDHPFTDQARREMDAWRAKHLGPPKDRE